MPEHALHTLMEELTELRARVAELEREREDSRPDVREQDCRTARESGGMSRRRLFGLLGGAATAGGLAVAGSTLGADRAHAADGDALIIGQENSNDDPGAGTQLNGSTSSSAPGANAPAMFSVNNSAATGTGISSTAHDGTGLWGVSNNGTGTRGDSFAGIGVTGTSTSGFGVSASSSSGTGVAGSSVSGSGTVGVSASGDGLFGQSFSSNGVHGFTDTGNALFAAAPFSTGAHLGLFPATVAGPPTAGAHTLGQFRLDSAGALWQCVVAGTPGTWVRQAPFVPLATPSRVYDSRVGQPNPSGSPQGPLAFGDPARTINCSPEVPAGASAILLNITVTDTAGKLGALVVFSAASPDPSTNSVTWTSPKSTACGSAASACDGSQDVKVKCVASPGCSTQFILDVTGYYT